MDIWVHFSMPLLGNSEEDDQGTQRLPWSEVGRPRDGDVGETHLKREVQCCRKGGMDSMVDWSLSALWLHCPSQ